MYKIEMEKNILQITQPRKHAIMFVSGHSQLLFDEWVCFGRHGWYNWYPRMEEIKI